MIVSKRLRARKLSLTIAALSLAAALGSAASAQTFASVQALSFTKPYAGADPLPQTLTLATTGSDFNFSVAASTSSGGAWLSVSKSGSDCCATPEAITVNVSAAASLTAGTYKGQIVFTKYPTTTSITVPVTLVVAPTGTAFFDNLPGQVSFFMATAANAPPSQALQVRNGGSGSLNWTLSTSTSDGGKWLTVTPASGTAPSTVGVSVFQSALPSGGQVAGTFTGQLTFQSSGGAVTVPVSVVVSDNAFQQVNAISFTKPYAGANPLPQTLTVASTGADFNFSVSTSTSAGGNWLTVSHTGNDCCVTPEAIAVSVNPSASLAAGTYTGQITVVQYPSNNFAMTIPVTLVVASANSAFFDNLPGQISFSMQTNGNAPPNQPLQVRNGGAGTLNWTLSTSTSDGNKWLTVSPASGVAPAAVSVGINKAALPGGGLEPGTFTGQLVFQTASDAVTVPVSVVVGGSVFEQVNGISFTKPYAGANPLPQTLTVASTGANFNFSVSSATATGGNWLTVSRSGNDCCITPEAISVSVNPSASLAAGTYTGQITVVQYPSNNFAMTIPVTLTVGSGQPFFDNLPGQLGFSMKTSGNAPPNQPLQVRNGGTGSLSWTLSTSTSDGNKWITVSPASGIAPSSVSVGIVKSALPGGGLVAGTFTGQLVFQTAGDAVTVPVSVVVGDSVFEQVNAINFTKPYALANPLPQTITIASTGADFNFSVATSTATGGNWLTVSRAGNDCCVTPEAVSVSVNPSASLTAGTYTGQITVTQYPNSGFAMTIPVTLTVSPTNSAFFDNVQGQLSYFLIPGAVNPSAQAVKIRNGGAGVLSWTDSTSTSDGGKWITASAASGTAPSDLTIGINVSQLPGAGKVAGTFTGEVVLQTGGDSTTIPVSVVVGDSVFKPLGALTFSKAPGGANPASQTFTVSSTSANVNFSVLAATAKGGSWFTVSHSGTDCCVTPEAITVTVNPSASLAAGTYTGQIAITQYPGGNFNMTVPVYLVIGTAPTISLKSSLNPSLVGQSVTFTAAVSSGSGTVSFRDGTTTIGTGTLSGGTASFTTSSLAAGSHSITAAYGGDSTHLPITSSPLTQTVTAPSATTTLTSSLNPSIAGTSVGFVAKVVTSSGSPATGTVSFKDGSTVLATVALAGGSASYASTGLSAGTHSLTATYSGGGASSPLSQMVLASTRTTLASSLNPSTFGQFVTLKATVGVTGSGQNGFVTFFDGANPLSTVALQGQVATLSISGLAKGTHVLSAVYGGSAVFAGSSSSTVTETVK